MKDLMKLCSQLALCYVVLYIIASAFGQKPDTTMTAGQPRNLNGRGGNEYRGIYSSFGCQRAKYYNPPVSAPDADTANSGGSL